MIAKPSLARWAAAAAVATLAACGGPSESELLASAKGFLDNRDNNAAIIQLKSALQANPESAEARYLLGKALLETGKPAEAAVELRKAADLKFDEAKVAPPLARALLAQGDDRRIVETWASATLGDKAAQADLKTTVAIAQLRLDRRDLGEKALAEALADVPTDARALLVRARLSADKQDYAAALADIAQVTAGDARNAEAWLLSAEIRHYRTRERDAALADYRKAAEAQPRMMAAHQGIVTLLIEARDIDGANAHVEQLKKTAPDQPVTKLLQAQMAYLGKDYAATRALVQPLLQQAPNNPLLLQLAGAAEFHLRALPQAENLLAQAIKLAPGLPLARPLLAETYLRTGQPEKALETLKPLIEGREPSAAALTLAGQAWLQTGDAGRAEEAFTRAVQLQPGATQARTALALGKIGKGNAAAGFSELETLASADRGISADLALISAHMRRREFDQALRAIDALEKKTPDRPLAANLRGRVLAVRNDAKGARASFERALAIDPAYFPAIASLAALDLAEKRPEDARRRFDDVLKADPKNHRAMLALAALLARTDGTPAEIASLLEKAVQTAPGEAAPRLQLVAHHLSRGDAKTALIVAQEGVTALPASQDLMLALARTQLAAQDWQQAVTSFNKLAQMQPRAVAAPLGLAQAYLGMKNYEAAERSYRRALEIVPNLLQAQRALVSMMVTDGRYSEALGVAREVQKQRPAEAAGHLLEGEVEQQRRQWDAALAAYRTALAKGKGGESAIAMHRALTAAGRRDEAERFATSWPREHPQDVAFRFYLGDVALGRKDWAQAESHYREVLRSQPGHVLALNNVAWLLVKQGKSGALPLAERAVAAAPGQPQILDTLALALAADNQVDKALALQKKTVERAPDDPSLRLTLAKLYLKAGDKSQARTELRRLEQLGSRFADHAEVAELLKTV